VKSFFRSFFASLLAIVVVLVVVVVMIAVKCNERSKIEDHSYLVVDIYGDIPEYNPPSGVMGEIMGGKPETLQRIIGNLEKAAVDDRIEGVIMKLSASHNAGMAMLQEIRGAIKKVQDAGKKVYGFTDSMDRKTYFLAAACDSLYMPPSGYFVFVGFAAVTEHVKGTLEKLGIKPNLHRIKDYKSAAELITREDMSPAARENREWMLDEFWDMYTEALEADRGLSEEQVVGFMDVALFQPDEACEAGLIDRVLYWDNLEDMLKAEKDEELRTVCQGRYAEEKATKLGLKGKKTIAVVHAQGMIGGRSSKIDPLFGVLMGHESVNANLRRARDDDDVAAIVFRIDSGGGEGLTSDLISRGVEAVKGEKPIVASMVDVAASGGYMIAYRASKIVADPITITGSIGSISMKFNMTGFYDKIGMTHDYVEKGPKALMLSGLRDFTDEERKRFEADHWRGFNWWLADVAEQRGMSFEEAEVLAHGRVWTGRQAKANGLIDEVGGLDRAIEVAKELAGISADEKVTVVHYPKRKSLFEILMGGGGDLTAVAKYVIYRFIRNDLAETWNTLTREPLYMMESVELH
jgi:protease-4